MFLNFVVITGAILTFWDDVNALCFYIEINCPTLRQICICIFIIIHRSIQVHNHVTSCIVQVVYFKNNLRFNALLI
jgi:hypothetical protein